MRRRSDLRRAPPSAVLLQCCCPLATTVSSDGFLGDPTAVESEREPYY